MARTQNNTNTQNAYVVRDLGASTKFWMDTFDIGPFFVIPHIPLKDVTYRGAPAELDISVALAFSGNVQIELIEQHNDGPSAYRDVVPAGEDGFHHICIYPDDYDGFVARYEAMDCPLAGSGALASTGTRFAYMDARARLNSMVEIVDAPGGTGAMWGPLLEATDNWDGVTDPIRTVSL